MRFITSIFSGVFRFVTKPFVLILIGLYFAFTSGFDSAMLFAHQQIAFVFANPLIVAAYIAFGVAIYMSKDIILDKYVELLMLISAFSIYSFGAHITHFQFIYFIASLIIGFGIIKKVAALLFDHERFPKVYTWTYAVIFYVSAFFIATETLAYAVIYSLFMLIAISRSGHLNYLNTNMSSFTAKKRESQWSHLRKKVISPSSEMPWIPLGLMGVFLIGSIIILSNFYGIHIVVVFMAILSFALLYYNRLFMPQL
jgi:hypothetical protein